MNKKDAAQFLGLSVKSLERYTTQKRIVVNYIKGVHGKEADYSQEELERLKAEIAANALPDVSTAIEKTNPPNTPSLPNHDGYAMVSAKDLMLVLEKIATGIKQHNKHTDILPINQLSFKMSLNFDEVVLLSGFPAGSIKRAIKDGSLKTVKVGRARRVRREDLEVWVKGL